MRTYAQKPRTPSPSRSSVKPQPSSLDVERGVPLDLGRISIFPAGPALVQPKLQVGQPGDRYEQEADRVSEQIAGADVSRRSAGSTTGPMSAPPIVQDVIGSPGEPLSGDTRNFMESRFHHDFSRVRVHADEKAARSAAMFGARAYTVGNDIVFAKGQLAPGTASGKRLLAHELTHVSQQSRLDRRLAAGQSLSSAPAPYLAQDRGGGDIKHVHDVYAWHFDPALFDKPVTNLDGTETGRMRLLGVQADAGLGARLRFFVLKVEAHGEHVHAEQTFLAAGAELGIHHGLEAEVDVVLVEGKVGGQGSIGGEEMSGSFVIGVALGAELKASAHHIKFGAKALIGFEIEFGQEDVEVEPGPDLDLPSQEDVSTHVYGVSHEEMPPKPNKATKKKAPIKKNAPVKKRIMLKGEVPVEHLGSSATASSRFRTSKI